MKDKLNEDGAVMTAGAAGFTSAASATGPVAGIDPVMKKYNTNIKNRAKKAFTKTNVLKRGKGGV